MHTTRYVLSQRFKEPEGSFFLWTPHIRRRRKPSKKKQLSTLLVVQVRLEDGRGAVARRGRPDRSADPTGAAAASKVDQKRSIVPFSLSFFLSVFLLSVSLSLSLSQSVRFSVCRSLYVVETRLDRLNRHWVSVKILAISCTSQNDMWFSSVKHTQ